MEETGWELRIKKLEEHYTRQIDENRKTSRMLDELKKQIDFLSNNKSTLIIDDFQQSSKSKTGDIK